MDLEYEAFALKTTLDDLQSKHYPGVGNDVQKLHHAIDNLEKMAVVRHEEDKMMALTKTALLKAVQTAKNRQMPGFERLPLRDQMRSATYAKEDVVRQLAETLNLDANDVTHLVQNAPALTPRPPSRQRTPSSRRGCSKSRWRHEERSRTGATCRRSRPSRVDSI